MVQVTEIFLSIQGESCWAGLPCAFVRLTGCPLRCRYCDTAYSFHDGQAMAVRDVVDKVAGLGCQLVEVTGGEPLAQRNCIVLLNDLLAAGHVVLLETSGALPVSPVPPAVHKIMDLKCPSSGEGHRNLFENIGYLQPHDEVKFVIGTREDYDWAKDIAARHELTTRCRAVLFSCVFGELEPQQLAQWMLADQLFAVRLQLQLHKLIWSPETRGV